MRRIFVTGSTGYLGRAIAERLARAGHEVYGLTRNIEQGPSLKAAGITPVLGHLADLDAYLATMKNCDVVVHAAADPSDAPRMDQRVLEAVAAAAQDGRVRRLLYTSGVWVAGPTGETIADETTPLDPADLVRWRPVHEDVATDLAQHEVATVVFRPGMVYGAAGGTIGDWFHEARTARSITYPGDGSQRWTMVHRDDVAEAYALGLEHAAGGEHYYLVDESRFTVRELAEAAAKAAGVQARPGDPEELIQREGAFGAALLIDQRITAAKARRELGWVPRHTSFVAEADSLYREWLAGQATPVG
jgi:nucleoside-diphosphate-sugar epimerase